jgi:hypothetical protein
VGTIPGTIVFREHRRCRRLGHSGRLE